MLETLRRRLTALFSVFAALILAAAVGVIGTFACRQYRESADALFSSAFSSVQDKLQNNDTLSDNWLAAQETSAMSVLYIEDNGTPLHFPGAWQPPGGRATLIAQALEQVQRASELQLARQNAEIRFSLKDPKANVRYACAAAILYRGTAFKPVLIVMLQDRSAIMRQLVRMILLYVGLWLLGTAALSALGWQLTGLALRPTRQALTQQSEFVAAASHELRSPLTVIKVSLEAAQESGGILPAAEDFCQTALQEADRMKLLTDDLLLLAGSDAHVWRMAAAPLSLDTFCIELYDQYHAVAEKQGHSLTLSLPDTALPTLEADAQRLHQLFAILLNNALEYAPSGTPITLCACAENGQVRLSVADHGKGIPDSEKADIFRRFYRADKSRTGKAHFGLGLSVAQEIAAMHRGHLYVEDTPGGGATFVLSLPCAGRG